MMQQYNSYPIHEKNTTIYIIGAGAIGKALAVFLKQVGKNVVLLRGRNDDNTTGMEKNEVELNTGEIISEDILVSTIRNYSTLDGIVVLTNKSYGNIALAEKLKNKVQDSPVVILQNGLDVEDPFIVRKYPHIYRCVLFSTCQFVTKNRLRFKPVAESPIGVITATKDRLVALVGCLDNLYFKFRVEQNILPIIWTKVIINCVFNSICPLLDTDNGIFHRDENALNIGKRLIAECVLIADYNGIKLSSIEILNSLLRISKSSEGQFISTYHDIKNKQETEISTLNLAIVNIAKKLNLAHLIKETQILGELVLLKSALSRNYFN